MKSATRMINRCYRHQHPEAFGRPPVLEPGGMHYQSQECDGRGDYVPESDRGIEDHDVLPLAATVDET